MCAGSCAIGVCVCAGRINDDRLRDARTLYSRLFGGPKLEVCVCVRCVAETCHASLHNAPMYCRKMSALLLLLLRGRGNPHRALMDRALTASGSQAFHRSLGATARAWASPPPKSRGASTMSNASDVRRRAIWPRCDNKSRCVSSLPLLSAFQDCPNK